MARYIDLENPMVYVGGYTPDGHTVFHVPSNAPTADVRENVHAHWVYKPLERSPEVTFPVCSNCDEDAIDYVESNFCPKCGAVMDEPTMEEYMYGQEGSEEDGSL